MLSFDRISKTDADGALALAGIDLRVRRGEMVALFGGPDCGKSALLRLAAGLDSPSTGTIRLDGAVVTGPRGDAGIISPEPQLFPWLSVAENIAFGVRHRSTFEREGLVTNALVRVGLAGCEVRRPDELAAGERQRLAIARALVTRPKLLLLDEPFAALDAATRASLHALLQVLCSESRTTVLLATQDADEAVALADRIVVMQPRSGRICYAFDNLLPRPRDRRSSAFAAAKREVRHALDRSLREEAVQPEQAAVAA